MFSAGDSSGDGISSLNQFTNIHGSVDWAVLAQQWIQMRDTNTNLVGMPAAPPPPNISCNFNEFNTDIDAAVQVAVPNRKGTYEEKGEADMEMEEDDDNLKREDSPPPPAPSMHINKTKDKIMHQHPSWFMQQQRIVPPIANAPGAELDMKSGSAQAAIAAPPWNANVWPPPMTLPPPSAILPSAQLAGPTGNPTAHIPSLMKINVANPNTMKTIPINNEDQNPGVQSMDAAKRKILPAWIREGLEKMEREKQKQMEKQQLQSSNKETLDGTEYVHSNLVQTVKPNSTKILESDSSGNEDDETEPVATRLTQTITADEQQEGVNETEIETDAGNEAAQSYVGKRSYEERLSDLMIVVRTTLTELLLEVTNEEISSIAHEAVNSRKAKASSAQVIRKSALTSITSKLGLAAYDDSSSDDSSGSENEATGDNDHNCDSEEDIKNVIRLKRRAFAKVSDEIEERIAASAAREEQKLKYYTQMEKEERHDAHQNDDLVKLSYSGKSKGASTSNSTTASTTVSKAYERDFGETTETILQHSNGKRQKERISRKERTTRFSDNKDSKSATIAAAAAATYISQIQSSGSGNVSNINQNASGSLFPATNVPSASTSAITSPTDSTNIYNYPANLADGAAIIDKSLLNAAEAAFDKVTKSKSSVSMSSSSERHHRRRHNRDHDRDRERERERARHQERRSDRDRDRERERERPHGSHRSHERYSSDDEKSSSSSSSETSSSSSDSSDYSKHSRTSSTKYQRSERDRGNRSRKPRRSRSRNRRKHRSDEYDARNGHYHHSSSRHSTRPSSKKRSRSRSRSTYSASSRKHRH